MSFSEGGRELYLKDKSVFSLQKMARHCRRYENGRCGGGGGR